MFKLNKSIGSASRSALQGDDGHNPMESSIRLNLGVGPTLAGLVYLTLPRSGELWGFFGEAKKETKQRRVKIRYRSAMG